MVQLLLLIVIVIVIRISFVFRWTAGVFYAWVFVLRGFGVAVGTHAIYDILVGWIAAGE